MYIGLVSVVVITFALHAKGHWFNPSMRQYLNKTAFSPVGAMVNTRHFQCCDRGSIPRRDKWLIYLEI